MVSNERNGNGGHFLNPINSMLNDVDVRVFVVIKRNSYHLSFDKSFAIHLAKKLRTVLVWLLPLF